MDYEVAWTSEALVSLDEALDYLRKRNEAAAEKVRQAIFDKADLLGVTPNVGRVWAPGEDPPIREVISGKHRIHYRDRVNIDSKTVEILKVWHSSRQEPKL
jgi:plasmid stabilization system protein ParE